MKRILIEIVCTELGSSDPPAVLRFPPNPKCTIADILQAEADLNKLSGEFTTFSVSAIRSEEP